MQFTEAKIGYGRSTNCSPDSAVYHEGDQGYLGVAESGSEHSKGNLT